MPEGTGAPAAPPVEPEAEPSIVWESAPEEPGIAAAPAVPSPEAEEAGEEGQEAEGTRQAPEELQRLLKDLKPDEFDALLKELPEDVRQQSALLREEQRRAEQRGITRAREELQARASRADLFQQTVAQAQQAAQYLDWANQQVQALQAAGQRALTEGDTDLAQQRYTEAQQILADPSYRQSIFAYRNGVLGEMGMYQDSEFQRYFAKHGPLLEAMPLTDEEMARIEQARYADATKGTMSRFDTMIDLIMERQEKTAYQRGFEAGLADRKAKAALAEKFKSLKETYDNTPGRIVSGAARAGGLTLEAYKKMSYEEASKLDPAEIDRMMARLASAP